MIRSHYQAAFSVAVAHSYFRGNVCSCTRFKPGKVTGELSKRFNFNVQITENGFIVYSNTPSQLNAFLDYISSVTQNSFFDFDLVVSNPFFYHFTDLPFNWTGQMEFDSSSPTDKPADGGAIELNIALTDEIRHGANGILLIYFSDIVKYSGSNGAQFLIRFKERKTQWQYYIINRSAVEMDFPAIAGKSLIDFTGPEKVIIATGEPALLFTSGDCLLPLSEEPKFKFDLINTKQQGIGSNSDKKQVPKMIYKSLPNPNPENMGITKIQDEIQNTSPMYIYI